MSNISSDTSSYRSDVLSVLNNIEAMFRMSQNVLCSHARNGLLFSTAMEAQMLALKLDTMADRWSVHIPFKEACKVNFIEWAKKIEQISQYLHDLDNDADVTVDLDTYCPDKHFLLDLYTRLLAEKSEDNGLPESLPNNSPYYTETNMQAFVEKQDRLHRTLAENWLDYLDEFSELTGQHIVDKAQKYSEMENLVEENINKFSSECLNSQIADMTDDWEIRIACCAALTELAHKLYALNESLERSFSPLHLVRLTDRILIEREYGGLDISKKVRTEIAQWKNATPDDEIDNGRNEEMQKAYNNIVEMKFRRNFQDYVKGYTPDIDQKKKDIGKFLFHCRADITETELKEFMTNLFRIIYYRKDQLQDIKDTPTSKASFTQETVSCNPDIYLSEKLNSSREAKHIFYSLLSKAGPYICHKLTLEQKTDESIRKYKGWSWWHLKQAFIKLGLIGNDISDKDFFKFISIVLPNRTPSSISQGYYRTKHDPKDGITEKVVEEFRQVAEMMG